MYVCDVNILYFDLKPFLHSGAGDLIHLRGKSTYEQCGGFDAGLLSSIRNHLKKSKFYNIEGLLGAFLHIDKVNVYVRIYQWTHEHLRDGQ